MCIRDSALIACSATSELKQAATQLVRNEKTFRADEAAGIAGRLYPSFMTTNQLLALIKNCPAPPPNITRGFGSDLYDFWTKCPAKDREKFATTLAELVLKPPLAESYRPLSKKYHFLAKQLPSLLAEYLESVDLKKASDTTIQILLTIARASRFDANRNDLEPITTLIEKSIDFRRKLFWRDAEWSRNNDKKKPTRYWQLPTERRVLEIVNEDCLLYTSPSPRDRG